MPRKKAAKRPRRAVNKSEKRAVVLKRIDPLAAAKLEAVIFAIFGLLVGVFMSAFSAVIGFPYGAISIIILPIIYGIGGFIVGAIGAFLYNVIADKIGGLKFDFE